MKRNYPRVLLGCGLILLSAGVTVRAQDVREFEGAARLSPRTTPSPTPFIPRSQNGLPNVLLTGYWPPTNEMLRQFSPNPDQNPGGWVGENWEGRGYNVYAFFPEFPGGTNQNPKGDGDFEVDYQDTSGDWWPLVAELAPLAIITFSRANTSNGWELEGGNRTYAIGDWTNDYLAPLQPTPELPIMSEPPGTERYSTLPIDEIIAAVTASGANVDPFSTVIDEGRFLSNFIGYHGCWYHVLHADPADPAYNVAGGHIHVGRYTALADAVLATEVTVRTLLDYVDSVVVVPGDVDCDGVVGFGDINPFVLALTDPAAFAALYDRCALGNRDLDGSGAADFGDINPFVALLSR